jgi:hypothetical protein
MTLTEMFEQLDANGIADLIQRHQEEHLHLDFKTINAADFDRDDRNNLAKAISGFANSNGGLIIWGVVAKKDQETGIDCASAAQEISSLRLFISRLNSLTGEVVSPIVDGIRHKPIFTTGDSGFAVTLIPENVSGPYMATVGEHRYYKRSGDSFYRMEHFDLADMFGRRQQPKLEMLFDHRWPLPDDPTVEELGFKIQNKGRAIARYVGFLAQLHNVKIVEVSRVQNASEVNDRPTISYANNIGVLHPNGIANFVGFVRFRRLDRLVAVTGDVSLYCADAPDQKINFSISPSQDDAAVAAPSA